MFDALDMNDDGREEFDQVNNASWLNALVDFMKSPLVLYTPLKYLKKYNIAVSNMELT